MNSHIKINYPSTYKDPNVGHKSVSFRATPKEEKKTFLKIPSKRFL
jgi:hypothetical protein